MRLSDKEKLAEAQEYFRCYQFRLAYNVYRQAFSAMPFQISQAHLEHISYYARVLLELDRLEELRFYLPILEQHYEKGAGPYVGYALGYIHSFLGSRARGQKLFEEARDKAGEDTDLRIKAIMMLAFLLPNSDTVQLIYSIQDEAKDPQLAKLLYIWRAIALRHQSRSRESAERLASLIETTEDGEWYVLVTAKDALIRALLQLSDFDEARTEIEALGNGAEWGKFRTVKMHLERLELVYREHLALKTILGVEKKGFTELTHSGHSIRVHQPAMREMIHLFSEMPSVTVRKASNRLKVTPEQLKETAGRFASRLQELQLPKDSLDFEGIRVHLVPTLRVSAGAMGGLSQW